MNEKINVKWWIESYEKRQKPHIALGVGLYTTLISFVAALISLFFLMTSTGTALWTTLAVFISALVFLIVSVYEIRKNGNKIKELAEIERMQTNIPNEVVTQYLGLIKSTTFRLRVPKKKYEEFKAFLDKYNK